MVKISKTMVMRILKVLHVTCTVALFVFVLNVFYLQKTFVLSHPKGIALIHVLYTLEVLWLMRVYQAYHLGYHDITELCISQTIAVFIANMTMYIVTCLVFMKLVTPLPYLLLLALQITLNVGWLFWANKVYFRYFGNMKAAIVYGTEEDLNKVETLRFVENKFDFVQKIQVPAEPQKVWSQICDKQMVIIAGLSVTERNDLIEKCIEHKIRVMMLPEISDALIQSARHMQCFYTPVQTISDKELPLEYTVAKRAFDIVVSFCALIFFLPVMLVTALAIKLDDGGPVFYRQTRLTKGGKTFLANRLCTT